MAVMSHGCMPTLKMNVAAPGLPTVCGPIGMVNSRREFDGDVSVDSPIKVQ